MKRHIPKSLAVAMSVYLPAIERSRVEFVSRGATVLRLGFFADRRRLETRGHEDDLAALALRALIDRVRADGPPTLLSLRAIRSAEVLARDLARPRRVRRKTQEALRFLGTCEADLCGTPADRRCGECMKRMCWVHAWRIQGRTGHACAACIRRFQLVRAS